MYEIIEHTADVGIRVRAASVNELFTEAARALFSLLIGEPETVRQTQTMSFHLVADDLESLLHDWLAELLYIFHVRRLVLHRFDVQVDDNRLAATVSGEPLAMDRHHVEVEVKAVTWHGLKVLHEGKQWVAEVVLDI